MERIWLWVASFAALAIMAAALVWLRSRGFAARLRRLTDKVGRMKRPRNGGDSYDLLRRIYALTHEAIAAKDEAGAYKAIDLMKTIFGHGVMRPDEPQLLAALTVRAVRAKQPDTAAAALDAYRHLLKRLPEEASAPATEQLTNVAAVALREKYGFLAAKAAEIILGLLERADWEREASAVQAAIRILGTVGVLVLRRRDGDLFREIVRRLSDAMPSRVCGGTATELVALCVAWLHRIVHNNDEAMFTVLAEFVATKAKDGLWQPDYMADLVKEWQNLAGTASLRPHSIMAPAIAELALRLSLEAGDIKVWEGAASGCAQTANMAIQRHGLRDAFPMVVPLLEVGREFLALELKFGSADNADSFRQQALYAVVRECLMVVEFTARQDLVITVGDVLTDFLNFWAVAGRANPKAGKRFCQLLAVFWLRTKGRQAKRAGLSEELTMPQMLSAADQQRLGFLL